MDLIYPTCCIFLTFFGVLQYSVLAVSIRCYFSVLMAQERVTYFAKPRISGTHQPVVISARELSTLWVKPPCAVLHWCITNTTKMGLLMSTGSPSLLTPLPSLPELSASSAISYYVAGGRGLAALPFVCLVHPDMMI